MTPLSNATPSQPSPVAAPGSSSLRLSKRRSVAGTQSPTSFVSTPPYRASSTSVSSLFASTSNAPVSRSESPNGVLRRNLVDSVFPTTLYEGFPREPNSTLQDPRALILQAYVPCIAVLTSTDTDELVKDKGFPHGLWQLLRPFGDHVQGKVTVRDSIGASRVLDDFAVRIIQLGDGVEKPARVGGVQKNSEGQVGISNGLLAPGAPKVPVATPGSKTGGDVEVIENLVDRHLSYAESFSAFRAEEYLSSNDALSPEFTAMSPFYGLYLRRLLSGIPSAPHETFSHPVACVVAISSRNSSPIETLRRLYEESIKGESRLPPWVYSDYLRYYVLVHDEERDDISKSATLFEQMKRHFGLHCHLLRLRSTRCVPTDDDSVHPPHPQWMSAAEELTDIQSREAPEEVEDTSPCIFESDATAIRTFIREMVTQSVVPSMERCISTWNDQVASRRRGISGRFISLSKKWTGFGGSRNPSATASPTTVVASNSNYDSIQAFYRPDAPEAIMRKLADYAFMLRDWKLAQSIYDLLRADFSNDKAWKYYAAANEMAAITTLLIPYSISSKTRSETVDQMLENASYSYITRCGASYEALRCLLLGMELLRLRGGSAVDDAARWGSRLLESRVVGPVGDALIKERVAACFATRRGAGLGAWGARTRKAALWKILAIDEWLSLGKYTQAEKLMTEVRQLYDKFTNRGSLSQFSTARAFLYGLEREVQEASSLRDNPGGQELIPDEAASVVDEESEAFDLPSHRKSLIGTSVPPIASLGTAPLQILQSSVGEASTRDDSFERF
jgi:trafficking protein particle complex subunit 8